MSAVTASITDIYVVSPGHQDGMEFLVMELVEGETLERRLTKGPLPPEQTIRFAAQIADALAQAHKLGIVQP